MIKGNFREIHFLVDTYLHGSYMKYEKQRRNIDIMDRILSINSTSRIQTLIAEIDFILTMNPAENELEDFFFKQQGLKFDPRKESDKTTFKELLMFYRDSLKDGLKRLHHQMPELLHLLRGQFNEDFDLEGENTPEIISSFIQKEGNREVAQEIIENINTLLSMNYSDKELAHILSSEFSIAYNGVRAGEAATYAKWLILVRDCIEKELRSK